jgi:MFS family permease
VPILYFVALNALGHVTFVGARMTTSLFALELGASPFTVGVVMALFAALPMLLSVTSGRLIDRIGPRQPLLVAFATMAVSVALPFAWPHIAALYVSSTLLGIGFMYVHIGMNSIFGAYGGPQERAQNFAWLALAFSFSGSFGPLIAGFAIEGMGHRAAFLLLAAFPALAWAMVWLGEKPLPRAAPRPPGHADHSVRDLFAVPGLRHIFFVSGMMAIGWDLYAFLMPIYGARIGLTAASIGIIMATFSIATFVVRLVMSMIIRRVRQRVIIAGAMVVSGASYLLFPLVESAPLLMAISFLLGLGLGCAQPVIMAVLYEAAPPGRQGEAVGVRTTMVNASQTFIPLTSGALSAALGMMPVFWLVALLLVGGAWFSNLKVR